METELPRIVFGLTQGYFNVGARVGIINLGMNKSHFWKKSNAESHLLFKIYDDVSWVIKCGLSLGFNFGLSHINRLQSTPSAKTKQSLHENYHHKYHHLLIWDKIYQSCPRNTHNSHYPCVHKEMLWKIDPCCICDLTLPSCVQIVWSNLAHCNM